MSCAAEAMVWASVAGAGDVGEEEDDVGAGGYGVEEVATGARGVVARVQIESFERRQSRGQRSAGGLGCDSAWMVAIVLCPARAA